MGSDTEARKRAAAILKKHPDAGHRTLAKALHDKHPMLFTSVEQARSVLRHCTGNNGTTTRNAAAKRGTARAPRKPGELPPLPKSEAKPWEPYRIDARRVLVLSDIHLPHHCVEALGAALEFGDKLNPDAILINGDLFDFYQMSRFDKDPTKEKVSHELDCGKQLFAHLRKRYPKAPITLKMGNHDERWDKYLWQVAPILFDIADFRNAWHGPAGIVEHKVTIVGDQRPVMLGHLPVMHGHELGRNSISNPVNPARGAFLRAHHTILVGHSHQTSGHADTNLWHDETFCWSTGALCKLTPEFSRVNRWNHGFACVYVAKDGTFEVQNMRISKDYKARS